MQHKIALDIDDVLAQFYPAMCRRFNQPCKRIDIWDGEGEAYFVARNFHIIEQNRNFWLDLEKEARPEDINFKVECYITSSPARMREVRQAWLYSKGFPRLPVITTINKIADMDRLGINVLVDDSIKTLELVKAHGLIPIQYVPSYMKVERPDLNPIRHLSQIPELLKNLQNG